MEYKLPPWKHQLTAIERAKDLPYFAFFFEQGAGKTCATINTLRYKMAATGKYLKTLVVAPPVVLSNWKAEFLMHSKIPEDRIVVLNGTGEQRLKTFMDHAYRDGVPRPMFFITNYESLLMEKFYAELIKWGPDAIVYDESHRLKNYKSKRAKRAEQIANPKGKVKPLTYILSGTPVLNSPMDLFYPFLILDNGATFGKNFFVFRGRFFQDKNAGMPKQRYFPDWRVRPGALQEISELIYHHGMRVTKAECLDLPEEVTVTIPCKMSGEQLRNYREMKQDFITYVGDKSASATLAIVKALRLMQITSGFLALTPLGEEGDSAKVVYRDTEKENSLRELLTDLTPHSKVIVWAVWKENYAVIRRVCEELKIECVEVHGGISRAKQDESILRFKSEGGVRVFIGHPGAAGIGINLTCAPFSIFFSRTFSLEQYLQARARNHRGGATEKVTHYDLVVEESIDSLIQKKLASKFEMSEDILSQKKLVQGLSESLQAQQY